MEGVEGGGWRVWRMEDVEDGGMEGAGAGGGGKTGNFDAYPAAFVRGDHVNPVDEVVPELFWG